MNLDAYRKVPLSDAEIASAHAAAERLRFDHGDGAGSALAEMARIDENSYHTLPLSAAGQSERGKLAKRLRAYRLIQHILADGFSADDNLFPDIVTLATGGEESGDDQTLRRHLFAAMIDVVTHAKMKGDDGHGPLLAELSDLAGPEGLAELKKILSQAKHMGLSAEGVRWLGLTAETGTVWLSAWEEPVTEGCQMLGWVRAGISRRSGKTRWRNDVTNEYRYQENEPGSRVRKQRSAEIGEHHIKNIHQQREVAAEHMEELAKHLPSMTVKRLREWRAMMGAWRVKGGSLKEGMVEAILSYAQGMVEQHKQREASENEVMNRPAVLPKGAKEIEQPAAKPVNDESKHVNGIDLNASPDEKVRQLQKLTAENKPIVDAFLRDLDAKFGTTSKSNVKMPERILEKSRRPSILAKKPWFGVEHVRDSFRCKTILDDVTKLPEIIAHMKANLGAESVKDDVDKFLDPLGWGWRIVSFDMKMPNGQMIEYYLPVKELEEQKGPNHVIFERWRNRDLSKLTPDELIAYEADREESQKSYHAAYERYLSRSGNSEQAIRAALTSAIASGPATDRNSSIVSSAENMSPGTHLPPTSDAANPRSSTSTRPSDALETTAIGKPSSGIVPPTQETPKAKPEKSAAVAQIKSQGRAAMLAKIRGSQVAAKPGQVASEKPTTISDTPAQQPPVADEAEKAAAISKYRALAAGSARLESDVEVPEGAKIETANHPERQPSGGPFSQYKPAGTQLVIRFDKSTPNHTQAAYLASKGFTAWGDHKVWLGKVHPSEPVAMNPITPPEVKGETGKEVVGKVAGAITKAGGPDALTADAVEQIRRDLYQKGGGGPSHKDIRDAAERMRQAVDVSPSSGPPSPDPATGIINPKASGVPGIVSGAVEVPVKPANGATVKADDFGEPYSYSFKTQDGKIVQMRRKGQKVRFFDEDGTQVGPEQANVAPAVAWAQKQGWKDSEAQPKKEDDDLLDLHDRAMQALREKRAVLPEDLSDPRKRYENILRQAAANDGKQNANNGVGVGSGPTPEKPKASESGKMETQAPLPKVEHPGPFNFTGTSDMGPLHGIKLTGGTFETHPQHGRMIRFKPAKFNGKLQNPVVKLDGRHELLAAWETHTKAVEDYRAADMKRQQDDLQAEHERLWPIREKNKAEYEQKLAELKTKIPSDHIELQPREVVQGNGEGSYYKFYGPDGVEVYSTEDGVMDHGIADAWMPEAGNAWGGTRLYTPVKSISRERFAEIKSADEKKRADDRDRQDREGRDRDKKRSDATAKREAAFAEAKKTGKKVILRSWTEDVDEEDNSLNVVTEYAMPDGSVKRESHGTY